MREREGGREEGEGGRREQPGVIFAISSVFGKMFGSGTCDCLSYLPKIKNNK
jgi:hypothetical protein